MRIVSLAMMRGDGMASLLEALQARERAARRRVEAPQAELDRLAEQVAHRVA